MKLSKSRFTKVPIDAPRHRQSRLGLERLIPHVLIVCIAVIAAASLISLGVVEQAMAQESTNNSIMLPIVASGNAIDLFDEDLLDEELLDDEFFDEEIFDGELSDEEPFDENLHEAAGQIEAAALREFAFPWSGTADPTARVFKGRLYVYTSTDSQTHCRGEISGQQGFCMPGYQVFSTTNPSNVNGWTNHGTVLRQKDVKWAKKNTAQMWAPDVIRAKGKYFMFFPVPDREGKRHIGVAVSNSPTGPFKARGNPIDGSAGIDPSVIYIKNKNPQIRGFYMFSALHGDILVQKISRSFRRMLGSKVTIKGLKAGYKEGPFVFKRNGRLWLHYAHASGQYDIRQARAVNPFNPLKGFREKGAAVGEFTGGTNHGSTVRYNGKQWYFYHKHRNDFGDYQGKDWGNYRRVYYRQVIYKNGAQQPFTPAKIARDR